MTTEHMFVKMIIWDHPRCDDPWVKNKLIALTRAMLWVLPKSLKPRMAAEISKMYHERLGHFK